MTIVNQVTKQVNAFIGRGLRETSAALKLASGLEVCTSLLLLLYNYTDTHTSLNINNQKQSSQIISFYLFQSGNFLRFLTPPLNATILNFTLSLSPI